MGRNIFCYQMKIIGIIVFRHQLSSLMSDFKISFTDANVESFHLLYNKNKLSKIIKISVNKHTLKLDKNIKQDFLYVLLPHITLFEKAFCYK